MLHFSVVLRRITIPRKTQVITVFIALCEMRHWAEIYNLIKSHPQCVFSYFPSPRRSSQFLDFIKGFFRGIQYKDSFSEYNPNIFESGRISSKTFNLHFCNVARNCSFSQVRLNVTLKIRVTGYTLRALNTHSGKMFAPRYVILKVSRDFQLAHWLWQISSR